MQMQRSDTDIPLSLLTPVKEALANEDGGEIVVRKGQLSGRIFVCKGKIAWVTCDSIPRRLREVLVDEANLTEQDLNAVLLESKRNGVGFAETLLSWGLLDQATLSRCLLLHNARHFQGIVALGHTMNAMFIPQPIEYSSDFLYPLDEILGTFRLVSDKNAAKVKAALSLSATLKKVATSLPGVKFIGVVKTVNHEFLARYPTKNEPEGIRQILRNVSSSLISNSKLKRLDDAFGGTRSGEGNDVVIISEDSMLLIQCLGKKHFVITQSGGPHNVGIILSKSRATRDELLKSIE